MHLTYGSFTLKGTLHTWKMKSEALDLGRFLRCPLGIPKGDA